MIPLSLQCQALHAAQGFPLIYHGRPLKTCVCDTACIEQEYFSLIHDSGVTNNVFNLTFQWERSSMRAP